MITFAVKEMIPDLKEIWKHCFHDSNDYIDFYFRNCFEGKNTLVFLKENKPIGMLTLLPAAIKKETSFSPVFYIYAVATLPKWQGKKIASSLLQAAKEWADQKKASLILIPANEKLFSYYQKQGYKSVFFRKKAIIFVNPKEANKDKEITISSILPEEYKKIRDNFFGQEGYVKWDLKAICYRLKENAFLGGFAYKVTLKEFPETEYALLGTFANDTLSIKEAILKEKILIEVLKKIAFKKQITKAEVILPVFSTIKAKTQVFAMAMGIESADGYFNLGLD